MNIIINKFTYLLLTLGSILITIIVSILLSSHEVSTIEYFIDSQYLKKENYSTAINSFKALADDKNVSQESRNSAAVKAMELSTNALLEFKIETTLKAAGYKYVICFIDAKVVRIIIKPNSLFTHPKAEYIINTVTELSTIKNIQLTFRR